MQNNKLISQVSIDMLMHCRSMCLCLLGAPSIGQATARVGCALYALYYHHLYLHHHALGGFIPKYIILVIHILMLYVLDYLPFKLLSLTRTYIALQLKCKLRKD